MAADDVWRLSCQGDISGVGIYITTMHIRFKSGDASFAGAAEYIKTNLLNVLKTYQGTAWSWRQINGNTVGMQPPQTATYTTGFPIAGLVSADLLPYQCACVVKVGTAYAGRSYRGRMYLPGLSESAANPGSIFSPTVVNAYQTCYEDLLAALGSGGSNADYTWVVYSKKLSASIPVTSVAVRNVVRNQRRRMPDYGV